MYSPKFKGGHALESDTTFSSIGATIADNFNVTLPEFGKSYLQELKQNKFRYNKNSSEVNYNNSFLHCCFYYNRET